MDEAQLKSYAAYCLSCPRPLCETGCPVGNRIRDFIKAVKENDLPKAAAILYSQNPYPEFTSALCDHERQCQGHCVRHFKGEPVAIPLIEGYLAAKFPKPTEKKSPTGKKIAIVGAGIAGCAAARVLLLEGNSVSLYEKESSLGGAIYTGIPGYRFDKKALDHAKEDLVGLGASFHFGVSVGKDVMVEELLKGYDAVLIAVGAEKENLFGLPKAHGILGGLSFLYGVNLQGHGEEIKKSHHKAIVWGGGNVALDCARTLIRLLPEVKIVYRRSLKEMPASAREVEEARKEGVEIDFLHNIKEPILENNKLVGFHGILMELGEKDASGRASCHEIPGSEYEEEADLLIAALGEKPDFSPLSFPIPEAKEGNATNSPKFFLAGDCRYGAKTVAAGVRDGVDAAKAISAFLMGGANA